MSGYLDMSCPLGLCLIGVNFDMTAHVFPIQLVGIVRAGAFMLQPTGFEPAVHAGLTTLNRRAASALLPLRRTQSATRWRKSIEHLMLT